MKSKKSTGEFGNCVDIYCHDIPSSYVGGGVTKSNSSIVAGGNKKSRVIHGLYTVYFAASDPYNFSFSCKLIVANNS